MRPSAAFAPDLIGASLEAFTADVRTGLRATPKRLPPRWLYDSVGSALFEAICQLPWYRITRAETALLERVAPALAARLSDTTNLIELGPGSGDKLARVVEAFNDRVPHLTAHLVDVSDHALELAARTLARFDSLIVRRHSARFEQGLREAMADPEDGDRLVLFLGSNIGNFDPDAADAFIRGIAAGLRHGDALLLGADLVKPEREFLLAYDDPIGVTAAFNRNLLARMNRELGASFDLSTFRHEARWNPVASRVEMHLVSARAQQVAVPAAGLHVKFEAGESIWTESSYKYEPAALEGLARRAGLRVAQMWTDEVARFALTLMIPERLGY